MGTEHMFNIFNELPMNYFVGFIFKYWQISWKMSKYLICFFFLYIGLEICWSPRLISSSESRLNLYSSSFSSFNFSRGLEKFDNWA